MPPGSERPRRAGAVGHARGANRPRSRPVAPLRTAIEVRFSPHRYSPSDSKLKQLQRRGRRQSSRRIVYDRSSRRLSGTNLQPSRGAPDSSRLKRLHSIWRIRRGCVGRSVLRFISEVHRRTGVKSCLADCLGPATSRISRRMASALALLRRMTTASW